MKIRSTLLLLALCACGSREEGIRLHLDLDLRPAREARTEGQVRQFTNAQGARVALTRAHVTLGSVEIFPCQTTSSAWRWLRALSPIGTAHAHEAGTPRRLGIPHVSGLERPDGEALALGTLQPPPGSYCRARLVFAPADADAEGLTIARDMEGKTLLLEGQFEPSNGEEPARSFHLESASLANVEVWLEGISLSEDTLEASRTIHLAYDTWLDGVDPTADDAAEQVLKNIASSATLGP